jgi:hypothetical protein
MSDRERLLEIVRTLPDHEVAVLLATAEKLGLPALDDLHRHALTLPPDEWDAEAEAALRESMSDDGPRVTLDEMLRENGLR